MAELRPCYTITQLAEMLMMDYQQTYRLVLSSRMRVVRSGARILVPLTSFKRCFPELWESLITIEQLRRRKS